MLPALVTFYYFQANLNFRFQVNFVSSRLDAWTLSNGGPGPLAHEGSAWQPIGPSPKASCLPFGLSGLSLLTRPSLLLRHRVTALAYEEGNKCWAGEAVGSDSDSIFGTCNTGRSCSNNKNILPPLPSSLAVVVVVVAVATAMTGNSIRDLEANRNLDKLEFTKAAKILVSDTPRYKKFGYSILHSLL